MKKTLALVLAGLLVMCGLSASAFGKKKADIEILPTMESKSEAVNQVWVGTFQLVWNDLVNEIIKHPIEFKGYKSVMAEELNKQSFTTEYLSDSAYYKKWGLASPELKAEIEQGIMEKFNEKSDILNSFDWTPDNGKYILYAMLKKDFEYLKPFDKLDDAKFKGSKGKVQYFGIDKNTKGDVRDTVHVLFYNNKKDFALAITTRQNDTVYLYRTNDEKTLDKLYLDMMKKYRTSISNPKFTKSDEFKAPNIDFKTERSFDELCHKAIKNSDLMIDKAIETVEFKMDNEGVKLKSEAGIATMKAMIEPKTEPRKFYFDDDYVIFLQEKGKPYFAMKVTDAKKLQK